jgi:hypothetical protein
MFNENRKIFIFIIVNIIVTFSLFSDEIIPLDNIIMGNKKCGIMIIDSREYGQNNSAIEEIILNNNSKALSVYKKVDGDSIFYYFSGYYRNAYYNLSHISFTLKLINEEFSYNDMESNDMIFIGFELTDEEIDYFKQDNNLKNQYEGIGTDGYGEYRIMKQIHFGNNNIIGNRINDIVQYFKTNYQLLIMYMQN